MKLFAAAIVLFALVPGLLVACGGGGGKSSAPRVDRGKVPTATLPANLPEPLIVEGLPTRAVQPSGGDTYTVESGDSLSAIAEKMGTTVEELMSLNGLSSIELSVGQVLRVPGGSSQDASPTPKKKPSTATPRATPRPTGTPEDAETETPATRATPGEGQTQYTVQADDNANDIALRFGVTVEELAAANGTTVEDLRSLDVGDVLIIPPASQTPEAEEPAGESTPAIE